ncbi:transposase [Paracoccus sp. YIM 132242]|uniref:Transposase n=1 Tax=Paracoccus lichenicola TaxID=2665644 RepID=A0A6L6HJ32_9RHOB|nr:transposase [Paracoccus lichenicola]MTD99196.1 transposase [Paracoccus lichenicola]
MSRYLRPRLPAVPVFFTVALAQRGGQLLVDQVEVLREAVRVTQAERPFGIEAWVVLPDHLHCIWRLPEGDCDYSVRWGAIKARFTRGVRDEVGWNPTLRSPSKVAKGDAGLWQRRFWDHHIRDERDLAAHVRYCWWNPVKHGYVQRPEHWPHSSVHRDIAVGRHDPRAWDMP